VAVVALATLFLCACDQLGPSATVNKEGLGDSAIGQYLREKLEWNTKEEDLRQGIEELMAASPKSADPNADAASLGLNCQALGRKCIYTGNVVYRFNGVPADSPHRGKQDTILIRVEIASYPNPETLTVRRELSEN
jgi:hypothetical protein